MAVSTTNAQITQATQLYVALFGRAPDAEGLGYWVQQLANGTSLTSVANSMYGVEPARGYYPAFMPNEDIVKSFYTNVLGRTGDTEGINYWTAKLNAPTATPGSVIVDMIVAVTSYTGTDATALTSQSLFNNKVAVGQYYGQVQQGGVADSKAAISSVTATTDVSTDAAKAAAITAGGATNGATYTLTTGADTVTGTSGNDIINGTFDAVNGVTGVNPSTLTVFDSINGGAGSDTLNIVATTAFTAMPGGASVSSVEKVSVKSSSGAVTLDTTTWGTTESVSVEAQAAAVGVTTKAASASVKGGTTVAVTDTSTSAALTGSTLTSVTINGAADDQTITANGLTSLNLTKLVGATTVGDTTVTAKAGTRALTVTYDGVDVGNDGAATAGTLTMTDAEATTLNIKASGSKSYDVTTVTAKATAVTIDAAVALQMDALTAGVAKTVAVSGAEAVTVSAHTLDAAAVITSTNTKSVTFTGDILATQTYTGGAGQDIISLAASGTKAITTGAGDDKVVVKGAFATGGSLDAGDGTDTLSLTEALAANDSLSANATFAGTISGFEKLELTTVTGSKTVNLANLDNLNYVVTAGATALVLDNLASAGTLELTGTSTQVTANIKDAATGTADVFNVIGKAAGTTAFGTVVAANVEKVNLTSTDSSTTPDGTALNTMTLTATAVTTITVGGNAGLNLTNTATTVTSFDASTSTVASTTAGADAKGVTWATGALADSFATATDGTTVVTIKGTDGVDVISGANVIDATIKLNITGGLGGKAGSTGDTLTGGAGDDTITASGLGNHILAGGGGKDTITGASGDDTITGGAGADTLKGNGGNDKFEFALASDSAPSAYDTITDFVAKTATANGDVLSFTNTAFGGSGAGLATFGGVFVASNGTLALAALSSNTDHAAGKVFFALDASTGTLYVDGAGTGTGATTASDGTADMAIVVTGLATIDTNAIAFHA
jgi:S-layer protein